MGNNFDNMIRIIGDYYQKLNLPEIHIKKYESLDLDKDPFVSFNLILINEDIVGFLISRKVPLNVHIHSFLMIRNLEV